MTTSKDNKWYKYENDIFGVNGLLDFETKESLADFMVNGGFIESAMPDGMTDEDKGHLKDYTEEFLAGTMDSMEYADEVLQLVVGNEGELDELMIEDFKSLCTGKTEFGQMTVEYFAEHNELEIDAVTADQEASFQNFFDTAYDVWIG